MKLNDRLKLGDTTSPLHQTKNNIKTDKQLPVINIQISVLSARFHGQNKMFWTVGPKDLDLKSDLHHHVKFIQLFKLFTINMNGQCHEYNLGLYTIY